MLPSKTFSLFLPFLLLPLAVLSLPDTYLPGPYTVDHVHFDKWVTHLKKDKFAVYCGILHLSNICIKQHYSKNIEFVPPPCFTPSLHVDNQGDLRQP